MHLLTGGALGLVAGIAVWRIACRFTSPVRDEGGGPSQTIGPPCGPRGILALPAAGIVAGMVLWGAYLGWRNLGTSELLTSLVTTALLLAISWIDLAVRRIPNALLLALLAWAVVQVLWLGEPTALEAALGMVVGGGLFLLLALLYRGAMGSGDVKLAAVLGAVAGLALVLPALLYGTLAGGLAAFLKLVTRRARRKDYMAYGPYLALGAWIVWTGSMGLWA